MYIIIYICSEIERTPYSHSSRTQPPTLRCKGSRCLHWRRTGSVEPSSSLILRTTATSPEAIQSQEPNGLMDGWIDNPHKWMDGYMDNWLQPWT